MATIRFASDAAAGGNGSEGAPYRDPGDLPSPWVVTPGDEYLFHTDTPFNFAKAFARTTLTTSPITFGTWGGNGRALIERYRMIDRSECVACSVATGVEAGAATAVTTVPPDPAAAQKTNLWRVPKQFFGLFGGRIWGDRCDIAGTVGGYHRTPSAAYQWGRSDLSGTNAGYHVIYSVGNPVDVYGGLFANTIPDADFNTVYLRAAIYVKEPKGGLVHDGIEYGVTDYGLRVGVGTVAAPSGFSPIKQPSLLHTGSSLYLTLIILSCWKTVRSLNRETMLSLWN